MTFRFPPLHRQALSAGALLGALVLGLSGCDSHVCVFGGDCFGDEGGGPGNGDPNSLGSGTATLPGPGVFLRTGAPEFVTAGPGTGTAGSAHPQTPIFLEFSESLNPDTLFNLEGQQSAFRVIDSAIQQEYPMRPPVLVGDGRVVVLVPLAPYQEGRTYQVFYSETQQITDLNGQLITDPSTDVLQEIFINSVGIEEEPRLIYAFPNDGTIQQADTSEFVFGFDREMDDTSIDTNSLAITVGGAAPAFNPEPVAASVNLAGTEIPLTQIYRWIPQEGGEVRPYGTGLEVVANLSDSPNEILSREGDALPPYETAFRTADFSLPMAVMKATGARPADAVGIADVFGGAPVIEVALSAAAPNGTAADVFMFGRSRVDPTFLKATVRTVSIPNGATTFTANGSDLGLVNDQGDAQFADGTAQFAVQLRDGNVRSAARRFDADPATAEIDHPLFDATAPVLLGLGETGSMTSELVGEVRDFAAFGRASEPIAYAFVDAVGIGNNGGSLTEPPPSAFSTPSPEADEAYFIAAAVPVGVLDPSGPGVSYEVRVYDRAFNASETVAVGTFTQRGAIGPGGAPTGSTVGVRVFSAETLAPIEGALVFSHQYAGGATTFVDSATTVGGLASVDGAGGGSTVITVEAAGFDLFTFHGVPRDQVDILLEPTMWEAGDIEGSLSGELTTQLLITNNAIQDTRAASEERIRSVGSCGLDPGSLAVNCSYGPLMIRPGPIGGLSAVGTNPNTTLADFTPTTFLLSFALAAPFAPVNPGGSFLAADLNAGAPLGLPMTPTAALALTPTALSLAGIPGFGTLAGDPKVSVEAAATGLAGPLLVGGGLSSDQGGSNFAVLSAIPGVAGPMGSLSTSGSIDPDLFLRMRTSDSAMNQVVARPRISNLGAVSVPMGVPTLLLPAPGGMTGGAAYNITIRDTLTDAMGMNLGLYRLRLTDGNGRGWTIVGLDTSDGAGDIEMSVPPIGANGGTPLDMGLISAGVEAYAGDLDRGQFLWSDLERVHELYSRAAAVTFTQN